MAGISDSRQPDDIRLHLETILEGDDTTIPATEGESAADKAQRESSRLPPHLRQRVEATLGDLRESAPGLTTAEVRKLSTTRAGIHALSQGIAALARVDSHLESRLGERNPVQGKAYGVYGQNPTSFAGVYRALVLSGDENARIKRLPEDDPERALELTPYIEMEVNGARDHLRGLMGDRVASRAELSRRVDVRSNVLSESLAAIAAVRNHLYANLPDRKRDANLRDYGFRPIRSGGSRGASGEDEGDESDEGVAAE